MGLNKAHYTSPYSLYALPRLLYASARLGSSRNAWVKSARPYRCRLYTPCTMVGSYGISAETRGSQRPCFSLFYLHGNIRHLTDTRQGRLVFAKLPLGRFYGTSIALDMIHPVLARRFSIRLGKERPKTPLFPPTLSPVRPASANHHSIVSHTVAESTKAMVRR